MVDTSGYKHTHTQNEPETQTLPHSEFPTEQVENKM